MNITTISRAFFIIVALSFSACSILDDMDAKKPANNGLIATPASYYSTAKARYLASKYKDNLDRLVERITRNPKTSSLQFANNISSVGGIGFFTHSATTTPDERYLEVVLATPETFELKGEYSEKVHRLFSRYGVELLATLTSDSDVYQDRDLSGYGLNLAWRNIVAEPAGNRVSLERAVIYFPKERVRNFMRHELSENDLLRDAVIFAVEEDGPLNLVSFKPPEPRPDFRPAIHEDNLIATPAPPKPGTPSATTGPVAVGSPNIEPHKAMAKTETVVETVPVTTSAKAIAPESNGYAKPDSAAAKNPPFSKSKVAARPSNVAVKPAEEAVTPKQEGGSVTTALLSATNESPNIAKPIAPVSVTKSTAISAAKSTGAEPVPTMETASAQGAILSVPPATSANSKKSDIRVDPAVESASPQSMVESPGNPAVEVDKSVESVSPPAVVNVPKAAAEPKKVEAKVDEKPAVIAMAPTAPVITAEPPIAATQSAAPLPSVEKVQTRPAEKSSAPEVVQPLVTPRSVAQKTPEAVSTTVPAARTADLTQPSEVIKPTQTPSVAKIDTPRIVEVQPVPVVVVPVPVTTIPEATRAVDTAKTNPPTSVAKAETPKVVEVKSLPTAAIPVPAAKSSASERPVEIAKPKELPSAAKAEASPAAEVTSAPIPVQSPPQKASPEKPVGERLALLREKAVETTAVKPTIARPAPKALEGFIIQLAFSDKDKAQRWAESMEKRGYAVSLTEAGAEGSLRVRLGNFAVRDEAERQLRSFKQDGLNGIVINLPQAFRPESRTSIP